MQLAAESLVRIDVNSAHELILDPGARTLFDYWRGCKTLNELPLWEEIDLLDVPSLVPDIVVHSVSYEPLLFRMILLGKNIIEQTRTDFTGSDVRDIDGADAALGRFETTVCDRKGFYMSDTPVKWSPHDYKTYSTMILPTVDKGNVIKHLLCWVGRFS